MITSKRMIINKLLCLNREYYLSKIFFGIFGNVVTIFKDERLF